MVTSQKKIQAEKKSVEFNLIDVNAKIGQLTPQTLGDHLLFGRHEAARVHELQLLEANREALIEQIGILDKQLAALQQAQKATRVTRGPTKQKVIYDRVRQLHEEQTDRTLNELYSIVADELEMSDEAVKERYNQQQRKEIGKKSKKNPTSRNNPPVPANKLEK